MPLLKIDGVVPWDQTSANVWRRCGGVLQAPAAIAYDACDKRVGCDCEFKEPVAVSAIARTTELTSDP